MHNIASRSTKFTPRSYLFQANIDNVNDVQVASRFQKCTFHGTLSIILTLYFKGFYNIRLQLWWFGLLRLNGGWRLPGDSSTQLNSF